MVVLPSGAILYCRLKYVCQCQIATLNAILFPKKESFKRALSFSLSLDYIFVEVLNHQNFILLQLLRCFDLEKR